MRRRPKRAHAKVEARRLAEALQREAELLDTIATNAVRVCGAYDATVLLREGEFVRGAAHHGPLTSGREDLVSNRVIRDADPVHLRFEEFRQVGTAAKKVEGRGGWSSTGKRVSGNFPSHQRHNRAGCPTSWSVLSRTNRRRPHANAHSRSLPAPAPLMHPWSTWDDPSVNPATSHSDVDGARQGRDCRCHCHHFDARCVRPGIRRARRPVRRRTEGAVPSVCSVHAYRQRRESCGTKLESVDRLRALQPLDYASVLADRTIVMERQVACPHFLDNWNGVTSS